MCCPGRAARRHRGTRGAAAGRRVVGLHRRRRRPLHLAADPLDTEARLVATAGRRDGSAVDEVAVDLALLEMAASVGCHLEHDQHGRGWVWGSGLGRVTVRFETNQTPPGPVRTFPYDDPALHQRDPT